ncbi:glycosyl transferase family 1 [Amylibacter marinus]|uniref:Glycosyl transferase family 1 n=2 Tax=Amylibacter marinus TaxID=1475483 RepID=A0ABQ5VRQ8_9RHOB|nr:glycosyl transferase family 1 [Amylibacter marinus]
MLKEGVLGRFGALIKGLLILRQRAHEISETDVFYCRNLDLLLLGAIARHLYAKDAQLVYEVLDIHPLTLRSGMLGAVFRGLERVLLRRVDLLVLSSRRFHCDYFAKKQRFDGKWYLLENKVPRFDFLRDANARRGSKISIGYVGKFRCATSLELLERLAREYSDQIELVLAGHANAPLKKRLEKLCNLANVKHLGPYRYPEGLVDIYPRIDLNWGLDIDGGENAQMLMPNRIYEGGLFGVPVLALRGTETADYAAKNNLGWVLDRPDWPSLENFIETITPAALADKSSAIRRMPRGAFMEEDAHECLLQEIASRRADNISIECAPQRG